MNRLKYFLSLLLLSTNMAISQETFIKGNVSNEEKQRVPDALITIKYNEAIHRLITDDNGGFKFKLHDMKNDSVYLSVDKLGYADITDSLVKINPSSNIHITLRESYFMLSGITVSASSNRIEKSDKIVYKLSSSDYIKGTQADIALRNIPDISISGSDIRLENRKSVTVFIDGIEASFNELSVIKAEDIDKIEVISNPSASFGSELAGGVIHIIRRNKMEHSFKGELSISKGVRLGKWATSPALAYQNKFITFNATYSYQANNQSSHIILDRDYLDGISQQTAHRITEGWQDYLSTRMRIILTPKSNIILRGYMYSYEFNTENDVNTKFLQEDDFTNYTFHSKEGWRNTQLDALYKYEINNDNYLYVKGKYQNYLSRNETNYIENEKVDSEMLEYSAEGVYEKTNIPVFSRFLNVTTGYKTIFRKYELDRLVFVNQNVHSIYGDLNTVISDNLSLSASLFAEYTRNTNENVSHGYNHILPVFSLMYKLPYKTNIRFNYSEKITRPSADYLNPNPVILNPLHVLVGNIHLLPQERYSYGIGITKSMKDGMVLSLNASHNTYTNLISETLTTDGEMIINSYNNLGDAYRNGLSVGFYGKLFNLFTLNINNGINYHYFSSTTDPVIVNENKGYSYNANINLNTLVEKNVLINLTGTYNSKDYSLARISITRPLFLLNIQTNLFKEKLKVELTCFDIFATYSKTMNYIHSPDFSQTVNTTNNMFNLELKMTYRFGKVFNDSFRIQTINNDDIITK
jgi:hypothetical protein